ncbi:DoxX family protein, partial [Candidatus Woesearchaeota archaeon]|nr:DoxX family protein [Candidatus Woesearchaeota archaeon]
YGPTLVRVFAGLLLMLAGLFKLAGPSKVTGMLSGLGFPLPAFFAWLLILTEVLFGLAVLVGYKVKYTVWPLVIVMAVAIFSVTIPGTLKSGSPTNLMFHLLAIASLVSVYLTGPGPLALSRS